MSQARNQRKIAGKNSLTESKKISQALQQIQVIAMGLLLAQDEVETIMHDLKGMRTLVHEVARRSGLTDEEIAAIEKAATEQPSGGTEG